MSGPTSTAFPRPHPSCSIAHLAIPLLGPGTNPDKYEPFGYRQTICTTAIQSDFTLTTPRIGLSPILPQPIFHVRTPYSSTPPERLSRENPIAINTTEIEKALTALLDAPVQVDSWHIETGNDWNDDPAIWIWGILDDKNINAAAQLNLRKIVRDLVQKIAGSDISVYIRFRAASEVSHAS